MKIIYKHTLTGTENVISVPSGGHVLSAHGQHGSVCLWVLVDPEQELVARTFHVYPTGGAILIEDDKTLSFIGTVLLDAESLVLHVFEVLKK